MRFLISLQIHFADYQISEEVGLAQETPLVTNLKMVLDLETYGVVPERCRKIVCIFVEANP
jgi:hypothetical protein